MSLADVLDHYAPELGMEHYLTEVWGHYFTDTPGRLHPRTWDDGVMPLWEFSDGNLGHILDQATCDVPPDRYGGEHGLFRVELRGWHEWHWTRGQRLRYDPNYSGRYRRHIPDTVRFAVYARDDWRCLHCGTIDRLTLDHIYPHSLGGADKIDNLQTLCRPCNSRKGAKV